MAKLIQPKTDNEIRRMTVTNLRPAYQELRKDFEKFLNYELLICPMCGEILKAETGFYYDARYTTCRYPYCKKCILAMVEQRVNKDDTPNETKESVMRVLQMMDRVYDDKFYTDCVKDATDGLKEKNRSSPFATYITALQSLPNWKGKTWKDSTFGEEFVEEEEENAEIVKEAKKRFGKNYSDSDLVYLNREYEDWTKRYACENKAQELLFKRICFKQLEIEKATQSGRDTKELDKTLQELMGSLSVKPSQSNSNALTEAKTYGQLIEMWENEYEGGQPIPEPEGDFKDVDKIGLYIDVFFKGHLSKMMNLKNAFSSIYDNFMSKLTVTRPQYSEDTESEELFEKIFGADLGDE